MKVSVAVIAHNEQAKILKLLETLERGTNPDYIDDLILIDNASTDLTLPLLQVWMKTTNLPARLVTRSTNNLGAARAQAVTECHTDWLAFIDADCLAPQDWLESLIHQLFFVQNLNQLCAGVGGPNRLPEHRRSQRWINQWLESPWLHAYSPQAWRPSRPRPVNHLATTNALFDVRALLEVGNFSSLHVSVGEDEEIGRRLIRQGHQLWLSPIPCVVNDCAPTVGYWWRRLFKFGKNLSEHCFSAKAYGRSLLGLGCLAASVLLGFALLHSSLGWSLLAAHLAVTIFEAHNLEMSIWRALASWPLLLGSHISYAIGCSWGFLRQLGELIVGFLRQYQSAFAGLTKRLFSLVGKRG